MRTPTESLSGSLGLLRKQMTHVNVTMVGQCLYVGQTTTSQWIRPLPGAGHAGLSVKTRPNSSTEAASAKDLTLCRSFLCCLGHRHVTVVEVIWVTSDVLLSFI